mmetsp:Transcript_7677/g.11507  ORF Transcript_7677/g.11507 Transcript_7677/m.11507 type:complete len:118 (-) Transcript_7677:206-559(-)
MTRPTSTSTRVISSGSVLMIFLLSVLSNGMPRMKGAGYCTRSLAKEEGAVGTIRWDHPRGRSKDLKPAIVETNELRLFDTNTIFCSRSAVIRSKDKGTGDKDSTKTSRQDRSNAAIW